MLAKLNLFLCTFEAFLDFRILRKTLNGDRLILRCVKSTQPSQNRVKTDDSSVTSDSENLHWCSWEICVTFTMTLKESKCCRECNILGEKLQGVKCITEHEEFSILCLNKTVLENAGIRHSKCTFRRITTFKRSNIYLDPFLFPVKLSSFFGSEIGQCKIPYR